MRTLKFLLYATLGVTAVLLLTSDKAKEMRDTLEDKAMENAKRWKEKLVRAKVGTDGVLADLKHS